MVGLIQRRAIEIYRHMWKALPEDSIITSTQCVLAWKISRQQVENRFKYLKKYGFIKEIAGTSPKQYIKVLSVDD